MACGSGIIRDKTKAKAISSPVTIPRGTARYDSPRFLVSVLDEEWRLFVGNIVKNRLIHLWFFFWRNVSPTLEAMSMHLIFDMLFSGKFYVFLFIKVEQVQRWHCGESARLRPVAICGLSLLLVLALFLGSPVFLLSQVRTSQKSNSTQG